MTNEGLGQATGTPCTTGAAQPAAAPEPSPPVSPPAPCGPQQTGPAQTGPAQTGPQQTGPAQTGPQQTGAGGQGGGGTAGTNQDECRDPGPDYIDYQVDAAGAKKESDLYTADAAAVAKAYGGLDGAQAAYAKAKDDRKAAFGDLRARLKRIEENLACVLKQADRDRLKDCWEKVQKDAETPQPKCDAVDGWTCTTLPTDIATLRSWTTTAAACVTQVDAEFERLAGLPKTLGTRVGELTGRATKLEAEVCGPRTDPQRSYVEYLQLHREFTALEKDWIEPHDYLCALRKLFRTLVHRHTLSVCLQVAVLRWDKRTELVEAGRGAAAKNLVDLVLECFLRPPKGAASTGGQAEGKKVAAAG